MPEGIKLHFEEVIVKFRRATKNDSKELWELQIKAFAELLDRYQDYKINPGNETMERIEMKLLQPHTYFYYIIINDNIVGAIRVIDMKDGGRKRIAPLFIMQRYRNKGYAQLAFIEAEKIHGKDNWKLDTILQEEQNCYLYEKMGYHKTGEVKKINDKMTIVYYEKN